ncbi:hypothetical protein [Micromonospora chersina]|uniref:hypothetical protein n=1 Tax=Micromonospora chersina TaxID=47854 RepID=UPI003715BC0E
MVTVDSPRHVAPPGAAVFHPLTVTMEEAVPPQPGALRYGDWAHERESHAEVANDPRWESGCLVARRAGEVTGVLLVRAGARESFVAHYATAPAAALAPGSEPLLLLGGTARLVGGAAVTAERDPWRVEETLHALLAHAEVYAGDRGHRLVALNVPHGQLPGFLTAEPRPAVVTGAGLWSVLRIPAEGGVPAFLAGLPRKARQTWARDARDDAALGLAPAVEPLSPRLITECADLVAAVSTGNGVADDPLLAEYRIGQWAAAHPGTTLAFTRRAADGRLVGVCLARHDGGLLDLYEVGLPAAHPTRRALYAAMVFAAPLRYAREHPVRSIVLGCGHPEPKRIRGAVQTPLYHVVYTTGKER